MREPLPSIPIPARPALSIRGKRHYGRRIKTPGSYLSIAPSRHSWTDRDKQEHTGYEVNWQLADILTRRRGLEDEDFEKLLGLAKEVNRQ